MATVIKNNHQKYEEEILKLNHPDCYEKLSAEYKQALGEWIGMRFEKATRAHNSWSYSLKHDFERDTGIYVTNGEFKGAMLVVGFTPIDNEELNWSFKIKIKK